MNETNPHDETQPVGPTGPQTPQSGPTGPGPGGPMLPPPPPQQQQPYAPAAPPAYPHPETALPQAGSYPPENHLVWGILTTVLCCLPLGVVSIVKSSQVNTLWWQGRHHEAYAASESAKNWAIASAGVSVALGVVWLLFVVVGGAVGMR